MLNTRRMTKRASPLSRLRLSHRTSVPKLAAATSRIHACFCCTRSSRSQTHQQHTFPAYQPTCGAHRGCASRTERFRFSMSQAGGVPELVQWVTKNKLKVQWA